MLKTSFKKLYSFYFNAPTGTGKLIPLIVIESAAICITYFISVYLRKSLGFDSFQVGKLISALSIGVCTGSVVSGYLTVKLNPTKVAALGFLIYALGFSFLSMITSYYPLMFTLLLCGCGGVFITVANLTALIKLAEDDIMKNKILVIQSVIFNFSLSIFSFLLCYLKTEHIKNLFFICAIVLACTSVFVFRIKGFNPSNGKLIKLEKNKADPLLLMMIVCVVFLYGLIYSLVKVYFPFEVNVRFNNNPWILWLILSANPLCVVLLQPMLINKLKYKTNTFLLLIGGSLVGFGYLFFGLTTYFLPSLLFICFATVGELVFSPISKKVAAISLGEGKEGLGFATWKMTYYVSGIIGASLVGYFGVNYKTINVWMFCAPLSLAIILCIIGFELFKKAEVIV
ncbi:MFS transporter [Legionella sp. D16C41]|uniref:MFS transporter n=1 Tax=Legionella sp. D16C41 TaxID=3402688 RepID=UPI003AF63EF7